MAQEQPIAQIPRATSGEFLAGAAVFLVLIVGALLIEGWRRGRERRQRLQAEWRAVNALMDERQFSAQDRATLTAFLEHNAPHEPLVTSTIRHSFDVAVDAELDEVQRREGREAFDSRGVTLRDIRTRLGLDYVPFGQRIDSTRDLYLSQAIWITRDVDSGKKNWLAMTVAEEKRREPAHEKNLHSKSTSACARRYHNPASM